jgi:hypothetical protein
MENGGREGKGRKETRVILDPEDLGFPSAIQTDSVRQIKGRRESSEALLPSADGRQKGRSEALLPNKISKDRTPLPNKIETDDSRQNGRSEALKPSEVSEEHFNSTPLPSIKVCDRHLQIECKCTRRVSRGLLLLAGGWSVSH